MRRNPRWLGFGAAGVVALAGALAAPPAAAFPRMVDPRVFQRPAAPAVPLPAAAGKDHDRITRMQAAIREILHGGLLRRLRVGIRVVEAATGRLLFSERDGVLMDPASNQKVLATTAALMRLGADWRFRTELSGPEPSADGVVAGDIYLRGTGDPTLRSVDIDGLAAALARRGVRTIARRGIGPARRSRASCRRGCRWW